MLFGFGVGVITHCPPEDGVLSLSPISLSYRRSFPLPGAPKRGGGARKELHHGDMLGEEHVTVVRPSLDCPHWVFYQVFYHIITILCHIPLSVSHIWSHRKENGQKGEQGARQSKRLELDKEWMGTIIYSAYLAM